MNPRLSCGRSGGARLPREREGSGGFFKQFCHPVRVALAEHDSLCKKSIRSGLCGLGRSSAWQLLTGSTLTDNIRDRGKSVFKPFEGGLGQIIAGAQHDACGRPRSPISSYP
jgi:hypothetical protein